MSIFNLQRRVRSKPLSLTGHWLDVSRLGNTELSLNESEPTISFHHKDSDILSYMVHYIRSSRYRIDLKLRIRNMHVMSCFSYVIAVCDDLNSFQHHNLCFPRNFIYFKKNVMLYYFFLRELLNKKETCDEYSTNIFKFCSCLLLSFNNPKGPMKNSL